MSDIIANPTGCPAMPGLTACVVLAGAVLICGPAVAQSPGVTARNAQLVVAPGQLFVARPDRGGAWDVDFQPYKVSERSDASILLQPESGPGPSYLLDFVKSSVVSFGGGRQTAVPFQRALVVSGHSVNHIKVDLSPPVTPNEPAVTFTVVMTDLKVGAKPTAGWLVQYSNATANKLFPQFKGNYKVPANSVLRTASWVSVPQTSAQDAARFEINLLTGTCRSQTVSCSVVDVR